MTHPDILRVEKTGYLYGEPAEPKKIGTCIYCGLPIYDDDGDAYESPDGYFCEIECVLEYHNVRLVN